VVFPKSLPGLLSLLVCLQGVAATAPEFVPVACPAVVLNDIPGANCAVRSNFSFLVFGSVPAATPSQACAIAAIQLTQSANIPTACQFSAPMRSCVCTEQGGFETTWPVAENSASLAPMCPADFTEMPKVRVPVTGPEGYPSALPVCVGNIRNGPPVGGGATPPIPEPEPCLTPPLRAMTDPISLQHERGKYVGASDLEHLSAAGKSGQACLVARTERSRVFPVAAYVPFEYQQHLKEVWDTWHALRTNTSAACKATRDAARLEWIKHKLVRDPQPSAAHAAGNAVDIAGLPAASADRTAAYCGMVRPDAKASPLHFHTGK